MFLNGLNKYFNNLKIEEYEIMTNKESLFYNYSKRNTNSKFVEFFKTNGSQMIKIIDYPFIVKN